MNDYEQNIIKLRETTFMMFRV